MGRRRGGLRARTSLGLTERAQPLPGEPSHCWRGHSRNSHCLLSTQQGDSHHLSPVPAGGVPSVSKPDLPGPALHPPPQGRSGPHKERLQGPGYSSLVPQGGRLSPPHRATPPGLWVSPEPKAMLPGGRGTAHTQGGLNPLPPAVPSVLCPGKLIPSPDLTLGPTRMFPAQPCDWPCSWEDRTVIKGVHSRGQYSARHSQTFLRRLQPAVAQETLI